MVVMYGIKNCDTIKKARRWLEANGVEYRFHDYRADGLDAEFLHSAIGELGWEALLNTRGTTWRKLDESLRASINNADSAAKLMLDMPAIIKRPCQRKAEVSPSVRNRDVMLWFRECV
ncbi:ArsC family reductase [Enterobacter asburiae]|uniref:ArsC family reductase n=1 Tax=Enterobacter asburiae TaxID=61645 RepID=UPI0037BE3294